MVMFMITKMNITKGPSWSKILVRCVQGGIKCGNVANGFKTVRIFPDDCQNNGRFKNCPDWVSLVPPR